ncbi:unnamed protein product [Soboliphyme baturini]|uniref:DNA-directed RNA polymerase n=1 Tax=Soboliphyme baturini TaxID=241478 RepID=A0A183INL7_9BILA|nr:unnamed protein product [Soboliphyme baturini]
MKTKVMQSDGMPKASLQVDGADLEEVNHYAYLGQELNMRHDLLSEIILRGAAGWRKFYDIIDVLKPQNIRPERPCSPLQQRSVEGNDVWM